MKTKTPKPKKKPAARPIPPPPPGWEIVGNDDPRLDCLPCIPLTFDPLRSRDTWNKSRFNDFEKVPGVVRNELIYALPITTQSATPQDAPASPPMIRLRLPSEKPTREDGDKDGDVIFFFVDGVATKPWNVVYGNGVVAWLPGRLPDSILPREPTQEEKWRAEFEECFPDFELSKQGNGEYLHAHAATAWRGFLAAKKGGAE
jgi:hypothetical protein